MPMPLTRVITSRQNSQVKRLRAAVLHSGPGDDLVAVEGATLLREALRSHLPIEAVFVMQGHENTLRCFDLPFGLAAHVLSPELFASAVSTESPQPLAALARVRPCALPTLLQKAGAPLVLIAAGLQDPGNLGTLVRSAEALGASGVITLPGTTNPFSTKALRASAGSVFRLPLVQCTPVAMQQFLEEHGIRLLAAVADSHPFSGQSAARAIADLRGPVAILIGNEGAGLSPELITMAEASISIPHVGETESLNAAVAGSILLYEAARQRALA